MLEVSAAFSLQRETFYLGLNYLDRFFVGFDLFFKVFVEYL
jgi:hypothetical protein